MRRGLLRGLRGSLALRGGVDVGVVVVDEMGILHLVVVVVGVVVIVVISPYPSVLMGRTYYPLVSWVDLCSP